MKDVSSIKNIGQLIQQKRSQFLVLAVVVIVAAIWSAMFITSSTYKTLDQRTQEVASQLKCPVCLNESVADSPSLLAQQMRAVIREQLRTGKSEQEVIQYFARSYGDSIIGLPPWQGFALLAWLVPIVLLLGGSWLLFFVLRDWSTFAPAFAVRQSDGEGREGTVLDEGRVDEEGLEHYRELLEQELATDDLLFAHPRMEAK